MPPHLKLSGNMKRNMVCEIKRYHMRIRFSSDKHMVPFYFTPNIFSASSLCGRSLSCLLYTSCCMANAVKGSLKICVHNLAEIFLAHCHQKPVFGDSCIVYQEDVYKRQAWSTTDVKSVPQEPNLTVTDAAWQTSAQKTESAKKNQKSPESHVFMAAPR